MESKILNLILGLITVISFVWAYVSEENRVIAIIIAFMLIILIIVSEQSSKVERVEGEMKRIEEKFKIYKELSILRAEVDLLKRDKK